MIPRQTGRDAGSRCWVISIRSLARGAAALEPPREQVAYRIGSAPPNRMTPLRAAQALQDALRLARRVEIADCGHAMMTEKPREVAAAMIEFLN